MFTAYQPHMTCHCQVALPLLTAHTLLRNSMAFDNITPLCMANQIAHGASLAVEYFSRS